MLVAVAALPASAAASDWSAPGVLLKACGVRGHNCVAESAPRAAVNARGKTLVVWVSSAAKKPRVQVAAAGPRGRFEKPITMGIGLRPSVAVAPDGTQVVVWSASGGLLFARRAPGHRFSTARRLLASGGTASDDSPKLAAQPDGSTVVVYESRAGLSTVTISPAGRPGARRTLGPGAMKRDSFRAAPDGQAAVCCLTPPAAAAPPPPAQAPAAPAPVAVYAPAGGWSVLTPPLAPRTVVETVGPGAGAVALGTIDVLGGGEAGDQGVPGLMRLGPGAAFAPIKTGPVKAPKRALGPVVAIDGSGRDVLVYQEKDRPAAFSRDAPAYAVVSAPGSPFGARQVLDRGRVHQPAVSAYRDGAVAAWQAPGNRWRVSVERDGRFKRAEAPAGPGPSNVGEDFHYSHDMAANGRYVVLTWTALDGSVRASIGKP